MYSYASERPFVFTEEGQGMFLKIRDNAARLLREAGAVRMQELIAGNTGTNWSMLACVDRLVELGELVEVTAGERVAGQHRIFTRR
jgi:hypothetical protein